MVDFNLQEKARQLAPDRVGEGMDVGLRILRDGSIAQIPWTQALCLEGRMFGVMYGSASLTLTVGTFGAGTPDMDEFDMLQTIPETVVVIPTFFKVNFVAIGTIAETDAVLAYGNSGVISGGHANTPYNLRPGSGNKSATTNTALGDDGGTAMTLEGVIYHEATTALTGVAATPAELGYEWSVEKSSTLPVLEGKTGTGRQVGAWASGQGGTGFVLYTFAELPIGDVA